MKRAGSEPRVVVILLNYLNWQDTVGCVQSLGQCTYSNFEILVVDNDSPNGSEAEIRKRCPQQEVIQTGSNLGYTGGVNYGIRRTMGRHPDYILILNPDTLVQPEFLNHLVDAMEKNPSAAAACGTIHCYPDTSRIWYAGGHLIPWRGLAVHHKSMPGGSDGEMSENYAVTFVTGCMLFLRASALDAVGLQDERFFMYLDDIEYSARILRRGFGLLYVPRSEIFHRVGSRDQSEFKLYYSVRNRLLLIETAFTSGDRRIARLYFKAVISAKLLFWRLFHPSFYRAARLALEDYRSSRFEKGRGVSTFLPT